MVHEYMGTGSSGGNATDGNDITSPRIGGEFETDAREISTLEYPTVTVLGSAVVPSLGVAVALVDCAPACNLVSSIVEREPLEPTCDNVTDGLAP